MDSDRMNKVLNELVAALRFRGETERAEAVAAIRAASVVPDGHVRVGVTDHKLLGTLPMTADGCVIGHPFCTLYAIHRRTGKVYETTWYHRGFGEDVYSTREAAESARTARGDGEQ